MSALPLTDPCCLGTDVLTELLGGTLRAEAAMGETSARGAGVHQRLWASSGQGGIPGLLLLVPRAARDVLPLLFGAFQNTRKWDLCSPGVPSPCSSHGRAGRREDEEETPRLPRRTERPAFPTRGGLHGGLRRNSRSRAVAPPSCSSPLPEDLSRNQQPWPPDLTPPGVVCSLKAREWSSVTDRPGAEPRRPGRRRGQLQTPA